MPNAASTKAAVTDDVALTRADLTLYGITVFVWGTSWLALRMQLGTIAPEVSLVWRFALAGAIVFVWATVARQRLRFAGADHVLFASLGFFIFSVNFLLFYNGGLHINAGLLSVIFSLASVINFLIGIVFRGERPHPRRMGGALLGALGIGCLFWPEIAGTTLNTQVLFSLGLCVLGTLFFCIGNQLSAAAQKKGLPILSTNAWGMLYGTAFMALLALIRGQEFAIEPTFSYVGSLFWLAVFSSVIAFWSYLTLLGRIGGARAAYATVIFPLVALASSTLFEGYQWSVLAAIGVAFALLGNWLVLGGGRKAAPVAGSGP